MKPLFDILKGDPDLTSPRTLTLEGRQALNRVEQALSKQQATYCDYTQEWGLYILPTKHTPTAVLFQGLPLRWLHLPASPSRVLTPYYDLVAALITLGRSESTVYQVVFSTYSLKTNMSSFAKNGSVETCSR